MKTKLLLAVILALLSLPASLTLADNGPHGGYTAATDACAGCHRAHTAPSANLLLAATPGLCYTCHGSTGMGADTNVVDGIYLNRDFVTETPPEGVANRGLKGGGFVNALMDTDALTSTVAAVAPTTSSHLADGSLGVAWGNGATGSGPGLADFRLSCTTCHDPHGSGAYRSLRPVPSGSGAAGEILVTDETEKTYTVTSDNNDYVQEDYGAQAGPLASWCSQCHSRYLAPSGSGHVNSGDPIFTYRHTTTTVSCVRCHVAHGASATMGPNSGAVPWPDGAGIPNGDARSALLRLNSRGVCAYCHVQADGSVGGGACDTCHGAPPDSGAHQRHAGPGGAGYGLTGSFATDTAYQYGCGECHPLALSQHQNGVVEVTLSPAGAPAGSLRALNDNAAAYDGTGCSGVYCHSGIQVTSGPVGPYLVDSNGDYIFDEHGNLTYDPYVITETQIYRPTPAWAGGQITDCVSCHEFPLLTSMPDVEAGVGNSHQWIGDYGYGNLHAWNMGFAPLACRTCHYGEITEANTWTRDAADVTTYGAVPLASRVLHANGQRDVIFDTVNDVVYAGSSRTTVYSLASASYDPATKSCSNVGCHLLQTYVEWGTPYRYWTNECDLCHRYGMPAPQSATVLSLNSASQPRFDGETHSAQNVAGRQCVDCHPQGHSSGQ